MYKLSKRGNKSLIKAVRKFNAKLTRLSKNPKYEQVTLPTRVDIEQLRKEITSSKELQRQIRRLNQLFSGNATDIIKNDAGVSILRYTKRRITSDLRTINKRRKIELEKAKEKVSIEKGNLHTLRDIQLKPKIFNFGKMDLGSFRKFLESVNKQSKPTYSTDRARTYKENYISALIHELGQYANSIIDLVNQISDKEWYDAYFMGQNFEIDFVYDPVDAEYKAEKIYQTIKDTFFNSD